MSLNKEITALAKKTEETNIVTQKDFEEANFFFETFKFHEKQIKNTFDPLIKKQREACDVIREEKNKWLDQLALEKSKLSEKMKSFIDSKNEELGAEIKKTEDELEQAFINKDRGLVLELSKKIQSLNYSKPTILKYDKRSFKDKYTFEIENEKLIPVGFLCPDETKIGQEVRTMKENTDIPGIKVFKNGVPVE